jgi:hypothetical protein
MKTRKGLSYLIVLLSAGMYLLILTSTSFSQTTSGSINLELRVSPLISNAQTINLTSLGIDNQGRGNRMFDLIIENNSDFIKENLYLDIVITSSTIGVIAEIYTENHDPFILRPRQVVVGNNNTIQNGLPGVENTNLNGRLTPAGEDFINELGGSTRLPDAIYSVTLSIYQGQNRLNGGRRIATVSETVSNQPIQNIVDFYLIQPGGPLGTREPLNTRLPIFRWDGPQELMYRLIVVEDNGQNPQSLIQSALSTDATLGLGALGGQLLEFEMIDALVSGTSFQYPPTGTPALREGRRYYWQIFAQIQTTSGIEVRPSEIMEFSVPTTNVTQAQSFISDDTIELIREVSPAAATEISGMMIDGYQIVSLSIDGKEYTGPALVVFLEKIRDQLRSGEITIVNR